MIGRPPAADVKVWRGGARKPYREVEGTILKFWWSRVLRSQFGRQVTSYDKPYVHDIAY